jgi:hypothetical protein
MQLPALVVLSLTAVASCTSPPADDADASGNDLSASYGNKAECTSDSPTKGRCLKEPEVAQLIRAAGFPESLVPTMVCTAKWESGFYERATNTDPNKTVDRGILQVNSVHTGEHGCPQNAEGFFDAAANAKCALVVYNGQQKGNSDPRYGINRAWAAYRAHEPECLSYKLSAAAAPPLAASSPAANGSAPNPPSTGGGSLTAGTCRREGGFYCGNPASNLKGDVNTLYHCVGGHMVDGQVCTNGCTVSATGVDDLCAAGTSAPSAAACVDANMPCSGPTDVCCDDDGAPQSCLPDPTAPNDDTFVCTPSP